MFATLYFAVIVDSSESELAIIDVIQTFVETLDKCFKNICELDIVFHSEQVGSKKRLIALDPSSVRRNNNRRNCCRNKHGFYP